jgi:hypothetical protein
MQTRFKFLSGGGGKGGKTSRLKKTTATGLAVAER